MTSNEIILIVAFTIILLVLRGYMGLSIRLVLNKKERKYYHSSYTPLSRWFFWSTHKVVKDIKNKYEKRTIRYKTIMMIYKQMNLILHIELLTLIALCVFVYIFDYYRLFRMACCVYTVSVACCILTLTCVEFYTNFRYHRNRYK